MSDSGLYCWKNWEAPTSSVPAPSGVFDCDNSDWVDPVEDSSRVATPAAPSTGLSQWTIGSQFIAPPPALDLSSQRIRDGYDVAANIVKQEVQQIIARGGKFTDDVFSINDPVSMIYKNPETTKRTGMGEEMIAKWERISIAVKDPVLYSDGIDPKDIAQGAIGSCWYLSALSVLGATPGRIEKCLVAHDQTIGVYGFVFYKNGKWITVVIDDYLPFDEYGNYVFAHSMDPRETWVALFEKAFAKAHGCFELLVSGQVTTGVTDMTSGCSITIKVDKNLPKETGSWIWNQIVNSQTTKDCCIGVGICKILPFGTNGIIKGHAYAVIGVYNTNGVQLVKIRNPWGQQGEWKGKWSDKDSAWKKNPAIAAAVNHVVADDGIFWMEWKDFIKTWNTLWIVKIFPDDWLVTQSYGTIQYPASHYRCTFELTQPSPIALTTELFCKSYAVADAHHFYEIPVSCTLLKGGNIIQQFSAKHARAASWWSDDGQTLQAGTYELQLHLKISRFNAESIPAWPFYVRVYSQELARISAISTC